MCAKFGPDRTTGDDVYTVGRIHTHTYTHTLSYIDIEDVCKIGNILNQVRLTVFLVHDSDLSLGRSTVIVNSDSVPRHKMHGILCRGTESLFTITANLLMTRQKEMQKALTGNQGGRL